MSSIVENLPSSLLQKVENDESSKTIINENKKSKSAKKKDDVPRCIAARVYRTIELAESDLKKGVDVYIHRVPDENDISKVVQIAYSRCTVKAEKNKNICHHHSDCKNLKIFDTDILPNGLDLNRRKATEDDDYFKKKFKRGRPTITTKYIIEFKNENNPVYKILSGDNKINIDELNEKAFEIIKKSIENLKVVDNNIIQKDNKASTSIADEIINPKNKPTKHRKLKAGRIDDVPIAKNNMNTNNLNFNDFESDSEEDEVQNVKQETPKLEESKKIQESIESEESENYDNEQNDSKSVDFGSDDENEDEEEEEDEEEDDEESEQIDITANNGKEYAYFPSDNEVYDPDNYDSEGNSVLIGGLIEMNDDNYVNIVYEGKKYGILEKIKFTMDNSTNDYYHCTLDNNVFDMNKNHVGKYVLIGENKFNIEFNNKKKSTKSKSKKN